MSFYNRQREGRGSLAEGLIKPLACPERLVLHRLPLAGGKMRTVTLCGKFCFGHTCVQCHNVSAKKAAQL